MSNNCLIPNAEDKKSITKLAKMYAKRYAGTFNPEADNKDVLKIAEFKVKSYLQNFIEREADKRMSNMPSAENKVEYRNKLLNTITEEVMTKTNSILEKQTLRNIDKAAVAENTVDIHTLDGTRTPKFTADEFRVFQSTIDGEMYATENHFVAVNRVKHLLHYMVSNPPTLKQEWSDKYKESIKSNYRNGIDSLKKLLNNINDVHNKVRYESAASNGAYTSLLGNALYELNRACTLETGSVIHEVYSTNAVTLRQYFKEFYSQYNNKYNQLLNVAKYQSIINNKYTNKLLAQTGNKLLVYKGNVNMQSRTLMAIRKAMLGDTSITDVNTIKDMNSLNEIIDDMYIATIVPDYTTSGISSYDYKSIYEGFTTTEIQDMAETLTSTIDNMIINTTTKPCMLYTIMRNNLLKKAQLAKDAKLIEAVQNDTYPLLKKLRNYNTVEQWCTFLRDGDIEGFYNMLINMAFSQLNPDIYIQQLESVGISKEDAIIQVNNYNTIRQKISNNPQLKQLLLKQSALFSRAMSNTQWSDIEDTSLSDLGNEESLVEAGEAGNLELNSSKAPHETMHTKVQYILSDINQRDVNGNIVYNTLGTPKKMRLSNVYYQILEIVNNSNRYIENSDVLLDVLIQNTYNHPFLNQVLNYVIDGYERNAETGKYNITDQELLSALYTDFNKVYIFMIGSSTHNKMFNVNIPQKAQSLLSSWYRNMADNASASDISFMDENCRLSSAKAKEVISRLQNDDNLNILATPEAMFMNTNTLNKALLSVGIKLTPLQLQAIKDVKSIQNAVYNNILYMLKRTAGLQQDVDLNTETIDELDVDEVYNIDDLYATKKYDKQYSILARLISKYSKGTVEDYYDSSSTINDSKKGWISKSSYDNPSLVTIVQQQIADLVHNGRLHPFLQDALTNPGMLNSSFDYTLPMDKWDIQTSTSPMMDLLANTNQSKLNFAIIKSKIGTVLISEKMQGESPKIVSEGAYLQHVIDNYFKGMSAYFEDASYNPKFNDIDSAIYVLPPMADSGNVVSVVLPRLALSRGTQQTGFGKVNVRSKNELFILPNETDIREVLHRYIRNSVIAELRRIQALNSKHSILLKTQNFDKSGKSLLLFPELNKYLNDQTAIDKNGNTVVTQKGLLSLLEEADTKEKTTALRTRLDELLFGEQGTVTKGIQRLNAKVQELKIVNNNDSLYTELEVEDYYLNDLVAKNSYINLLISDPAYFKTVKGTNDVSIDLVKRIKAVNSHMMRGDTSALPQADQKCRTLYVTLEEVTSEIYKYIDSIYANLPTTQRNKLKKQWSKSIDRSDGQGILTAHGLECQLLMQGYSTEELKSAIAEAEVNGITEVDSKFHTQVYKPVYMGVVTETSHAQRIPTYIKNSEFPATMLGTIFNNSAKIKALMQYAKTHNIHKIQFTSALKAGGYNAISIDNVSSVDDIANQVNAIDTKTKGAVIHELDWGFGGEMMKTDRDKDSMDLGIQALKLPVQNMQYSADKKGIVTFRGKELTGKEYINLYYNVLFKKLFGNYKNVMNSIDTPTKLKDAMVRIMTASKKIGTEGIRITDQNADGSFVNNLSTPTTVRNAFSAMASIFKRASKITVPGKINTQATEVLIDDKAPSTSMIAYTDIQVGKYTIRKGTSFTYETAAKYVTIDEYYNIMNQHWKAGNINFQSIEIIASVPKHWYNAMIDKNGKLDVKQLPSAYRNLIGYRVPSEGDCSILPMFLKDVVPTTYGHTVVVPRDFVAITGSDFDVDKVFSFFRDMSVSYTKKAQKAYKDYFVTTKQQGLQELLSMDDFIGKQLKIKDNKYGITNSDIIINKHDPYTNKEGKEVEINEDSITTMSEHKANNLLLDLMLSRFRSPQSTIDRLKQSNYESIKQVSDIVNKYINLTEEERSQITHTLTDDIDTNPFIQDYINNNSIDTSIYINRKEQVPLYDTNKMYELTQQNNESINNVGPFAIFKAVLALLEDESLTVNDKYVFKIGKTIANRLAIEKDSLQEATVYNIGQGVASSVDGAKDPRLKDINITSRTVNIAMTMVAMGYSLPTLALFLRHPMTMEISKYATNGINSYSISQYVTESWLKSHDKYSQLDNDAIEFLKARALSTDSEHMTTVSEKTLLIDLMNNDLSLTESTTDADILNILYKIASVNNSLRYFTASTRFDKTSVCINSNSIYEQVYRILYAQEAVERMSDTERAVYRDTPLIASYDTINKEMGYFLEKQSEKGGDTKADNASPKSINDFYNIFRKSIISVWKGRDGGAMDTTAMYAEMFKFFGFDIPNNFLGNYFKELAPGMLKMLRVVQDFGFNKGNVLTPTQIEEVLQLHTKYMMSKLSTFGPARIGDHTIISATDKMYEYVAKFPNDFVRAKNRLKQQYPDLQNNLIINNVSINLMYRDKYSKTRFINLIDVTPQVKDPVYTTNMINAWSELLNYTDNKGKPVEEVRELARQLVIYTLMLNGGYYTTKSIASYIPKEVYSSIEGYNDIFDAKRYESFESMLPDLENFKIQSILNSRTAKMFSMKGAFDSGLIRVTEHSDNPNLYQIENTKEPDSNKVFDIIEIAGGKITYNKDVRYDVYTTMYNGTRVVFIPKIDQSNNTVEYIGYPKISNGDYVVMDASIDYTNIADLHTLIAPVSDYTTNIGNANNTFVISDSLMQEVKDASDVYAPVTEAMPEEFIPEDAYTNSQNSQEIPIETPKPNKVNTVSVTDTKTDTDGSPVGSANNPSTSTDVNVSTTMEQDIETISNRQRKKLSTTHPDMLSPDGNVKEDWYSYIKSADTQLTSAIESTFISSIKEAVKDNNNLALNIYLAVHNKAFRTKYLTAHVDKINYETVFNDLLNSAYHRSTELSNLAMEYYTEKLKKAGTIKEFYSTSERTEAIAKAKEVNDKLDARKDKAMKYRLGIVETTNKDGEKGIAVRFIDFTDNTLDSSTSIINSEDKTTIKAVDETIQKQATLYDQMMSALTNSGIDVQPFQEDIDNQANGTTDFTPIEKEGKQLVAVVRLSQRKQGTNDTLTEEFAHVVIRSMMHNKKVKAFVDNIPIMLQNRVLGTEYTKYLLKGYTPEQLQEEVAGKLLANYLNVLYQMNPNASVLTDTEYSTLATQAMQAIVKQYAALEGIDMDTLMTTLSDIANITRKQLAQGILDTSQLVENSKNRREVMYQLQSLKEDMQQLKAQLRDFRKTEYRKLSGVDSSNMTKEELDAFTKDRSAFIESISARLGKNDILEGIADYNAVTVERLSQLDEKMQQVADTLYDSKSGNKNAVILRDIHRITKAYASDYSRMKDALFNLENDHPSISDEEFITLQQSVDKILNTIAMLNDRYSRYIYNVFAKRIMPLVDEWNQHLPVKKKVTIQDVLSYADRDVSWVDRWLYSAGDSNNVLIRIFDKIKTDAQNRAKLDTLDMIKTIQAAAAEYHAQTGDYDFSFMYGRDYRGNMTGQYYTEYNQALYESDKKAYYKEILQKVKNKEITKDTYFRLKQEWAAEYEDSDGKVISDKYKNPPLTAPQQKFFNKFMRMYKQCVDMLPPNSIDENGIICIPKGSYEEAKSMNNVQDLNKLLTHTFSNIMKGRLEQDVYYVSNSTVDFDGSLMECLPIYYTKLPYGESYNDMTQDAVSSIIAFVAMANNYRHMNHDLAMLEIGRDITDTMKIAENRGTLPIMEKFKYGKNITEESRLYKSSKGSNFKSKLDDFFSSQVYGNFKKSGYATLPFGLGTWQLNKIAGNLNALTSLYTYAGNLSAGIANIGTGMVQAFSERFAGEYFTGVELSKADVNFWKELPSFMSEVGKIVKTNKLSLFLEQFNVLQDYQTRLMEMDYNKSTRLGQLVNTNALYVFSNSGELFLQSRTALALALNHKLKNTNTGEEVSLWDALEVQYIDSKNHNKGAKIVVPKHFKNLDGSAFSRKSIASFSEKSKFVNQRMHGIYNREDFAMAQLYAAGQLAFMFKKYFIANIQRRYQKQQYSYALGKETEGYYRTFGRFLLQSAKDLKNHEFDMKARWGEMTLPQKANCKRAIAEYGLFLVLLGLCTLRDWKGDGDDDDEKNWGKEMFKHQCFRITTELQGMVPGVGFIKANLKLFDNPAASLSLSDRLLAFLKAINLTNWDSSDEDNIVERGKYKGHTKGYKNLMQTIPMYSTMYNGFHPWEVTSWYEKDLKD